MDETINRLKHGDEQAFELLFRKYYVRLCGFVNKFLNEPELAKELVQEVFFKIWENRANLSSDKISKSYIFKMAQNISLNHLKHKAVEDKYAEIYRTVYCDYEKLSPYESLLSKELEININKIIDDFPQKAKKIFILNRQKGLKYKEIAQELNISIKTVETQMSRSLKKLRQGLKEYLYLLLALLFFSIK